MQPDQRVRFGHIAVKNELSRGFYRYFDNCIGLLWAVVVPQDRSRAAAEAAGVKQLHAVFMGGKVCMLVPANVYVDSMFPKKFKGTVGIADDFPCFVFIRHNCIER